jgi:hypothetical protein
MVFINYNLLKSYQIPILSIEIIQLHLEVFIIFKVVHNLFQPLLLNHVTFNIIMEVLEELLLFITIFNYI